MAIDKTQLKSTSEVTSLLGIAGKTISTVNCYRHGSVEVTDILCTDAVHYFIKSMQGQVEVGTVSPEWGTGTKIGGR